MAATAETFWCECTSSDCSFRYPAPATARASRQCPRCGSPVSRFPALPAEIDQEDAFSPQTNLHLEALLDNLRSAYNVGSIFRTADGLAFRHIYLAGITPCPIEPAVRKTSLGAEGSVPWSTHPNAVRLAQQLRSEGAILVGLERTAGSAPITAIDHSLEKNRLVLVVGSETAGIDPELLSLCDPIARLPMLGVKSSYNVAVAFAIAAFYLRFS